MQSRTQTVRAVEDRFSERCRVMLILLLISALALDSNQERPDLDLAQDYEICAISAAMEMLPSDESSATITDAALTECNVEFSEAVDSMQAHAESLPSYQAIPDATSEKRSVSLDVIRVNLKKRVAEQTLMWTVKAKAENAGKK